tara:strand:+ start:911 stop:1093 length:183 start_codon:yes stop_codon:yes gene_type:complete
MKLWILNTFFKKELVRLRALSIKMQSYKSMTNWDEGFVCGLHHATQELINQDKLIKQDKD